MKVQKVLKDRHRKENLMNSRQGSGSRVGVSIRSSGVGASSVSATLGNLEGEGLKMAGSETLRVSRLGSGTGVWVSISPAIDSRVC